MRTVAGANSVGGFPLCGSFCAFVFIGTLYMLKVWTYAAAEDRDRVAAGPAD